MEVDRKHTQETSRNHHPSSHHMEPPREGISHTWQRDTERETKEMGYTRREMEGWQRTENSGVPWSRAYAPTQLGLNINRNKTKIMKAITKNNNPITLEGEPLEETDSFTYQGSTINKNGSIEEDVKTRIKKARVAFILLRKIGEQNNSTLTPN